MIYLDTAAATPVRREVLRAMWPFLAGGEAGVFANPSSRHEAGEQAAAALADARARIAAQLGARPGEVVLTGGGTEADNLAIKGIALATPRGRHLVIAPTEHEAVRESADFLQRVLGFEVTEVPVDAEGRVTPAALAAVIRADTTLVAIAHASNEIGTVQDLPALAAVARASGIPFHSDAVQSAGWLPLSRAELGVDSIALAGHKLGAPRGIGALVVRSGLPLEPVLHGGGQERGRRSGTEDTAGAVGLATALELAAADRTDPVHGTAAVTAARDEFIDGVLARIPDAVLIGARADRLPNHAVFCFPGTAGEAVLLELERRGVAVSSGSACAAGSDEPSPALLALGIPPVLAQTSVRFTLPHDATADAMPDVVAEVERAVAAVTTLRR